MTHVSPVIGLEDFIVNQGAKPTAALIVAWNLWRWLPSRLRKHPGNLTFLISTVEKRC